MYDKLLELIDTGWNIHIKNVPKRIKGEFVCRIVWKATLGIVIKESKWEGFETADEALEDMLDTLLTV